MTYKDSKHKLRFYAAILFALFHTLMVIRGVIPVDMEQRESPTLLLAEHYRVFTGGGENFGFFSPNIPDQIIARAEYTHNGEEKVEHFGYVKSELDFMLASMMHVFNKLETHDLHARTLAAHFLSRHQDVSQVKIILSDYVVPAMDEFRRGQKPRAYDFYEGTFGRIQ